MDLLKIAIWESKIPTQRTKKHSTQIRSSSRRHTYRFSLGRLEVDNGYDAFSLDNDRFTRSDEPGEDDQETTFFSLSMDRKIGESVAAEISGGWADSNITYGYDEDWTFKGFDPWEYSSTDSYKRRVDSNTYQIRLRSEKKDNKESESVDWVVGVYVYVTTSILIETPI